MEAYHAQLNKYRKLHQRSHTLSRWISAARLGTLLLAGAAAYFYLQSQTLYIGLLAGLGSLVFIGLLFRHAEVKRHKRHLENLLEINTRELAYLKGDLSTWPDGREFRDPDHLFAYDMDLFGPHSLFVHLNRTVTRGGKAGLADALTQGAAKGNIPRKQEANRELAQALDWRQQFTATGMGMDEDPRVQAKLRSWLEHKASRSLFLHPLVLYLPALLAIGLGVWLVLQPTLAHFNGFMYACGLNLLLVFSQFKRIRLEHRRLEGISKSLLVYGALVRQVEEREFSAPFLQEIRQKLYSPQGSASKALREAGRILDRFDQLHNAVALLFTNGLYLNHLHALRALYQWKKKYGHSVENWLDAVAVMDTELSLANFTFNFPGYTYPEITEELVLEAEQIGHPLIHKDKRVSNSLSFSSFKYVVLTGSNMSGKSTFLKTVGINLVLAKAGLPVCAQRLRLYPFELLSSMKLTDSLAREESYFQTEVLRLKRIREKLESPAPALVVLDEILRGTNSEDKRKGTRLFMKKIASCRAVGLIATHDIDIADLAVQDPTVFRAFYFESKVQQGALYFDYRLRKGVCTTPNATELMRAHGVI